MTKSPAPEREKLAEQAALFMRNLRQLQMDFAIEIEPILAEQYAIDMRLYLIMRRIEMGAAHPGTLAKLLNLPNSVITRHLDQIVERGLMERSLDPDDSRRIKLTLTKEGERVARETHRTICGIVGARLERLTQARREGFLSALSVLAADTEENKSA